MSLEIKTFDFPSFEDWFKTRKNFKLTIGQYTVKFEKFWPTSTTYLAFCYNISFNHYRFEFDDEKDINNIEKIANFKKWYEDTCVKLNEDFVNHIYQTYMKEDKIYD